MNKIHFAADGCFGKKQLTLRGQASKLPALTESQKRIPSDRRDRELVEAIRAGKVVIHSQEGRK